MTPSERPGRFPWCRGPACTRGVFGLFFVIIAAGFGWSATHTPAGLDTLNGPARASQTALAYAACQAHIRRSAPDPARLRFPSEPESTEADGADALSLSSSLIASPPLGAAYTQHFTCRAERGRRNQAASWRVTRMAMDLPVS